MTITEKSTFSILQNPATAFRGLGAKMRALSVGIFLACCSAILAIHR